MFGCSRDYSWRITFLRIFRNAAETALISELNYKKMEALAYSLA